jgi:hypothetical protein
VVRGREAATALGEVEDLCVDPSDPNCTEPLRALLPDGGRASLALTACGALSLAHELFPAHGTPLRTPWGKPDEPAEGHVDFGATSRGLLALLRVRPPCPIPMRSNDASYGPRRRGHPTSSGSS